jgi:hypothetical protein
MHDLPKVIIHTRSGRAAYFLLSAIVDLVGRRNIKESLTAAQGRKSAGVLALELGPLPKVQIYSGKRKLQIASRSQS